MKDTHLTLRLPGDLARELERAAERRGVPKSMIVREAVSRYLVDPAATAIPTMPTVRGIPGIKLAELWRNRPHVEPEEAAEYERLLRETLDAIPPLDDPWA